MRADDPARAHYFRAVQPVAFIDVKSDPMLMGDPLLESRLRQMKIYEVNATFHVDAEAKITGVDVKPGTMPANMVAMFSQGFQHGCVLVRAVDHGKFVDGIYIDHRQIAP